MKRSYSTPVALRPVLFLAWPILVPIILIIVAIFLVIAWPFTLTKHFVWTINTK